MKDRLNKLIETEGLTPSLFADKIGINRPTVSHVLTGRNNPGYDFIQKILIAFPKLNAEWLLLGNGDMYKRAHINDDLNRLFSNPSKQGDRKESPHSFPTLPDDSATKPVKPTAEESQKNIPSEEGTEIFAHGKDETAKTKKVIDRIVVLYSDKTFSDYSPT
jgi:transcriptional regulator with XRE-family HTH domain